MPSNNLDCSQGKDAAKNKSERKKAIQPRQDFGSSCHPASVLVLNRKYDRGTYVKLDPSKLNFREFQIPSLGRKRELRSDGVCLS